VANCAKADLATARARQCSHEISLPATFREPTAAAVTLVPMDGFSVGLAACFGASLREGLKK
jgi:hypothetical protein